MKNHMWKPTTRLTKCLGGLARHTCLDSADLIELVGLGSGPAQVLKESVVVSPYSI